LGLLDNSEVVAFKVRVVMHLAFTIMADLWKNWSEKEKQAFYESLEIEANYKSLMNYFQQLNKKLGRSSVEKIRKLYYRGLITIKQLCKAAGYSLESTLPESKFFEFSNFDLTALGTGQNLKSQIKSISKYPELFSVRLT